MMLDTEIFLGREEKQGPRHLFLSLHLPLYVI